MEVPMVDSTDEAVQWLGLWTKQGLTSVSAARLIYHLVVGCCVTVFRKSKDSAIGLIGLIELTW